MDNRLVAKVHSQDSVENLNTHKQPSNVILAKEGVAKSINALNHKDTKAQRKIFFACQA